MKCPLLLAVPVLCLAVAAACGGSGEPGKPPGQETPGEPTTPPDQGTSGQPTPPPVQGTSGDPTAPPDQGTGDPTTPPEQGTSGQPTTPPGQPTAKYLVRIDCVPVNDFGYIGWAKRPRGRRAHPTARSLSAAP
jgi:hypothetical protein